VAAAMEENIVHLLLEHLELLTQAEELEVQVALKICLTADLVL
jgi:hypothetical protein